MSCHVVREQASASPSVLTLRAHPLRVALVGQPNVGKSVVFGRLTGRYVTVSNYPGTTVAITKGRSLVGAEVCDIIDTPGVNALEGTVSEDERITREVLTVVPQHQREAVLALGATRWEMIRMGVLRNARAGIVGAIILGLGRALGETMAVTMVIGNRPEIAKSLFAPGYTMASVLANEFTEATGDLYLSALIEIGLALFFVTIVVNALARLMVWSVTRGQPARSLA